MALKRVGRIDFLSEAAARQHLVDWLFLETLQDLRERTAGTIDAASRYRILGIAPLLRKLLADGPKTLLTKVRAPGDRPAPRFKATAFDATQIPDVGGILALGIRPYGAPDSPGYNLDQFLKLNAGRMGDHDVTVRQVIRHYANVEGGVHVGSSEGPYSDLIQLTVINPPASYPLYISVLADIAFSVTAGCMPLERVVRADYERRQTAPRPDELDDSILQRTLGLTPPES